MSGKYGVFFEENTTMFYISLRKCGLFLGKMFPNPIHVSVNTFAGIKCEFSRVPCIKKAHGEDCMQFGTKPD